MAETTKACNLTKEEIVELMRFNGMKLYEQNDEAVERIKYLNGRLKAFAEAPESAPVNKEPGDKQPAPVTQGWT